MGHVFDPEVLHEIAKKGVGLRNKEAFDVVANELAKVYPDHITVNQDWFFNNAGGAMASICLLHASISEYLVFFGSPIGTEGHTGRNRTEIWDFIISGELWNYEVGETDRIVYKAGDAAYIAHGHAKGYRIPEFAWTLKYARGPIPSMLGFAVADGLISTLDFKTLKKSLFNYTKLTLKELRQGKI